MTGKKLLDLDDDGAGEELNLQVNTEYAKRFEHNKKREELHKLQAKHPELAERIASKALRQHGKADEEDEDESSSEEEDDGDIPDETEARIFDTLLRIRRKDPSIYDPNVKFFEEPAEEEEEDGEGEEGKKKAKPMRLKDVLAKQALEGGADEDDEDEDQQGGDGKSKPGKVYDAEQEELRKAFLTAVEDVDEGEGAFGGVLVRREGGEEEDLQAVEASGLLGKGVKKSRRSKKGAEPGPQLDKLLDEYFGGAKPDGEDGGEQGDELGSDGDAFLRDFIAKKAWVEHDDHVPTYREVIGDEEDDAEDEEALEAADRFEAAYNFRFEEPGGIAIATHPRMVEGSVRRVDDTRKRQREAKKARQAEAEATHNEEIKRLKNLKKKEIEDKLKRIAKVAGAAAPEAGEDEEGGAGQLGKSKKAGKEQGKKKGKKGQGLKIDASLLDGDFDPEEWDRKMAAAFDDDYYGEDDDELEELLGDEAQAELDALAATKDVLGDEAEEGAGVGGDEDEGGFKALRARLAAKQEGDKAEKREEAAGQRAELSRLLEEYYALDHEGVAGGIKTRFKYREVAPSTYGMSIEDILMHDDKELNQVVGLKRLAPYIEHMGGKAQRPNYKALEALKQQGPQQGKGGRDGKGRQAQGKSGKPWPKQDKHRGGQEGQQGDKPSSHAQEGSALGADEQKAANAKAARLASYGRLTLGKGTSAGAGAAGGKQREAGKKRRSDMEDGSHEQAQKKSKGEDGKPAGQEAAQAEGQGSGLSRAQKKNLKRAQRRARGKEGEDA